MKLILGDSLLKLKDLPTNTVDAVVTDPPYGLKFMNKHWDCDVPSAELWREVFRVMKPGAHLLSFFGTRTYHAGVSRIEDAGFEVRDMLAWLYGSGFPKSLDVSKAIDKQAGAEREVIGIKPGHEKFAGRESSNYQQWDRPALNDPEWQKRYHQATAPTTDAAKQWAGWGTALKPANEPIVLARKPLEKGLTVAQNVQKWGTGAINVDAGRIGTDSIESGRSGRSGRSGQTGFCTPAKSIDNKKFVTGRWPANVLFDEEAAAMLDEQSLQNVKMHHAGNKQNKVVDAGDKSIFGIGLHKGASSQYSDATLGASRFFYVAKASKRERNAGLEGTLADKTAQFTAKGGAPTLNGHPTVKPIKLMEYLIKLVAPPGGVVLDPFMGSGTTGCAAKRLGFQFIGIEREAEYLEIARKRIEHWSKQAEDAPDDPDQSSFDLEGA